MEHFNKLTPEQVERLAILAEEAAEVIQAVNKILRHGYDNWNPDRTFIQTNRTDLAKELGQLWLAADRVIKLDLDKDTVSMAYASKIASGGYMHHQGVYDFETKTY